MGAGKDDTKSKSIELVEMSFWVDWTCPCFREVIKNPDLANPTTTSNFEIGYSVETLLMYVIALAVVGVFGAMLVNWIDVHLIPTIEKYTKPKIFYSFNKE